MEATLAVNSEFNGEGYSEIFGFGKKKEKSANTGIVSANPEKKGAKLKEFGGKLLEKGGGLLDLVKNRGGNADTQYVAPTEKDTTPEPEAGMKIFGMSPVVVIGGSLALIAAGWFAYTKFIKKAGPTA